MTPEGRVKMEVRKVLDRMGVWYFMPVGGMYGRHGISDFVAVVDGMALFIETKRGDGEVEPLQELFLQDAVRMGGAYTMVFRPGDVRALEQRINTIRGKTWQS